MGATSGLDTNGFDGGAAGGAGVDVVGNGGLGVELTGGIGFLDANSRKGFTVPSPSSSSSFLGGPGRVGGTADELDLAFFFFLPPNWSPPRTLAFLPTALERDSPSSESDDSSLNPVPSGGGFERWLIRLDTADERDRLRVGSGRVPVGAEEEKEEEEEEHGTSLLINCRVAFGFLSGRL